MSRSQTVVVAGATGFIGSAVMECLHRRGWQVIVVSTDPAKAKARFPAALACIGYEGEALEQALAAHGKVIRLSGANPLTGRWTAKFKSKMWESRVGTARRMAAVLTRSESSDRVIVSAGGINIHPDLGELPVSEASPHGSSWVANMLHAKEEALVPAQAAGVRTVTMRIGLAFGKEGGPFKFIEQPFHRGMGGHVGNGRQYVPWLHVNDLARMFVTALEDPKWEGPVIAAAPNPVQARELAKMVGQCLGRSSWLHVPIPVAHLLLGEMATLVLSSYKANPAKAQRLGFEFQYPDLASALDEIYHGNISALKTASSQRAVGALTNVRS